MTNQNLSHRHISVYAPLPFSHSFINGIEKLHNFYAIRVRTCAVRTGARSHRLTSFDFGINHSIQKEKAEGQENTAH